MRDRRTTRRFAPPGLAAILLVSLLSSAAAGSAGATASSPRLVDLGAVSGDPLAVNSFGEIAGTAERRSGAAHAVVWTVTPTGAKRRFLPVPERWPRSAATDINDAGIVVGYVTSFTFADRPVVWRADGMHYLGRMHGRATGINTSGEIVGWIDVPHGEHAVVWHRDGTITDLSSRVKGAASSAWAINDKGVITGVIIVRNFHWLAFVLDGNDLTRFGKLQNANITYPNSINRHGKIVGHFECNLRPHRCGNHGAAGEAFVYNDGQSRALPSFAPASGASASAVNDAGVIVGTDYDDASNDPSFAVIWTHGTETKLDDLISDPAFEQLTSADDVNQSGMIVGEGAPAVPDAFHGFAYIP